MTDKELDRRIRFVLNTHHTIVKGTDPNDVYLPRIMQLIKAYTDNKVLEGKIEELEKWHRWDGRDYDNETDEAIDERIEQLNKSIESKL